MTVTTTFLHQPDIQKTLDIYAEVTPHPTARASDALRVLLQDHYREEEDISWQASTLTGDGFPLEFVFIPIDTDLRYTTEISSPLTLPAQRLERALQRLQQLGSADIPAELLAQLQQIQDGGVLSYGTWVGGRHGVKGDSFKLYVEVPLGKVEDYQSLLKILGFSYPKLADRAVYVRMIGYNLSSKFLEIYFRLPYIEDYHLKRLLAPCGLTERASELWHFLEEIYGYSLSNKLPGSSVGISYSIHPNGTLPIFTLFLFANIFWGSDASICRKFTALAKKYNWDIDLYLNVTKGIATRKTWQTYHGILGFVMLPDSSITISLGVRPWSTKRCLVQNS